jgi:hypothetical protein
VSSKLWPDTGRHRPPAGLTLFWQLRLFSSDVRSIRTFPTGFMVLEH